MQYLNCPRDKHVIFISSKIAGRGMKFLWNNEYV